MKILRYKDLLIERGIKNSCYFPAIEICILVFFFLYHPTTHEIFGQSIRALDRFIPHPSRSIDSLTRKKKAGTGREGGGRRRERNGRKKKCPKKVS